MFLMQRICECVPRAASCHLLVGVVGRRYEAQAVVGAGQKEWCGWRSVIWALLLSGGGRRFSGFERPPLLHLSLLYQDHGLLQKGIQMNELKPPFNYFKTP